MHDLVWKHKGNSQENVFLFLYASFSMNCIIYAYIFFQMLLTATEAGIDDTVTLEGNGLMNSALNSQDSILPTQIPISVKREVSCIGIYCFSPKNCDSSSLSATMSSGGNRFFVLQRQTFNLTFTHQKLYISFS